MSVFRAAKDAILSGSLSWSEDVFAVALVGRGFSFKERIKSLDEVRGHVIRRTAPLEGCHVVDGACDADDIVVDGVSSAHGRVQGALVYRTRDGMLVSFNNEGDFPFKGDGGSVLLRWDNGPSRIFRL